jgi:hypothetical protein
VREREEEEEEEESTIPTMSEPISQQIRKLSSTTKQQTHGNHRFEADLAARRRC